MTGPASFWARRRAGVEAESAADAAQADAAIETVERQALAEKPDAEILAELELPDPDTLTQGDDFAAFMSKAVPEHLRKRALRKLWRSNPVLACVDGLNDYDEDFLTGSFGQGPIQTTYQVGKGMLAHVLEVERQAALTEDEDAHADACAVEIEVEVEVEATETLLLDVQPDGSEIIDNEVEVVADVAAFAPRRMQFEFVGDKA